MINIHFWFYYFVINYVLGILIISLIFVRKGQPGATRISVEETKVNTENHGGRLVYKYWMS